MRKSDKKMIFFKIFYYKKITFTMKEKKKEKITKHIFSFQFSKWKLKLKTKNDMMVKLIYNNL